MARRLSSVSGERVHIRDFDCMTEFIDFCIQPPPSKQRGQSARGGSSWSGTATFEDAVELARNGWAAGGEMIAEYTKEILPSIMSRVALPEIIHDYSGGSTIDMGRFMEGDPECFYIEHDSEITREVNQNQGKIIKIVVNLAVSAGISENLITARGSAVVALIDALEATGKRVELWAVCAIRYGGNQYETQIIVKRPNEPLNIDALAFTLAHPSMLRRMWFAQLENEKDGSSFGAYGNYGYPADTIIDGEIKLGKMYSSDPQWNSREACMKWVLKILEEQGVELREVNTV